MSYEPELTIGIPTLDRAEHLQHALNSCLQQTCPVHIIVADQGHSDKVAKVLSRYRRHPNVQHEQTKATCLWENWEAAARACDTKYFAWLQDDDEITEVYAERMIKAFESFPDVLQVQATCYCSPDRVHVARWAWNGPALLVDMKNAQPERWPGEVMLGASYIMSWALSPGVAFRCGEHFNRALSSMPNDCDLFSERLILAYMGAQSTLAVDPMVAGYWHHHGQNESYKQNRDGSLEHQYAVMIEHLDRLCDTTEDWDHAFVLWLRTRSPDEVCGWLSEACKPASTHPLARSRHTGALRAAMNRSLEGRVTLHPAAQGNGHADPSLELVWN